MSENVTVVDEATAILAEYEDYSEYVLHDNIRYHMEICYISFLILTGVPCNILPFLILIRRRLWLQNEAYVYLAAILIINIVDSAVVYSQWLLELLNYTSLRISITADVLCKLWVWLLDVISYSNWLYVLMSLNVYLRQQLITSSNRRGCYMNLAAKYCTLLGTKVVISSFFISCAIANFWSFSISTLQSFGDIWFCFPTQPYFAQERLLMKASWWLGDNISLLIVTALLLLIIWKTKRSSGFVFSQINGVSQDNGDVEVMVRIVICTSSVLIVLRAPIFLIQVLDVFKVVIIYHKHVYKISHGLHLISIAHPLSTPIVCFTMKSRIREDLKAIVNRCCNRCCPGAICHRTLSPEPDSNDTVVLGMVPIEENTPNI